MLLVKKSSVPCISCSIVSHEGLILVGEKKTIDIAVINNKIEKRNTRLSERLRNNFEENDIHCK